MTKPTLWNQNSTVFCVPLCNTIKGFDMCVLHWGPSGSPSIFFLSLAPVLGFPLLFFRVLSLWLVSYFSLFTFQALSSWFLWNIWQNARSDCGMIQLSLSNLSLLYLYPCFLCGFICIGRNKILSRPWQDRSMLKPFWQELKMNLIAQKNGFLDTLRHFV